MKKTLTIIIILYTLFISATFGGMFVKYLIDDVHKVKVDYTIYTNSGAVNKIEIYEIRGDSFISKTESYRGSNKVYIKQTNNWFAYTGNQAVCIYVGTNDVIVNKIEVIE